MCVGAAVALTHAAFGQCQCPRRVLPMHQEQTLNQLLTELDGFSSGGDLTKPVICIAATNRSVAGLAAACARRSSCCALRARLSCAHLWPERVLRPRGSHAARWCPCTGLMCLTLHSCAPAALTAACKWSGRTRLAASRCGVLPRAASCVQLLPVRACPQVACSPASCSPADPERAHHPWQPATRPRCVRAHDRQLHHGLHRSVVASGLAWAAVACCGSGGSAGQEAHIHCCAKWFMPLLHCVAAPWSRRGGPGQRGERGGAAGWAGRQAAGNAPRLAGGGGGWGGGRMVGRCCLAHVMTA